MPLPTPDRARRSGANRGSTPPQSAIGRGCARANRVPGARDTTCSTPTADRPTTHPEGRVASRTPGLIGPANRAKQRTGVAASQPTACSPRQGREPKLSPPKRGATARRDPGARSEEHPLGPPGPLGGASDHRASAPRGCPQVASARRSRGFERRAGDERSSVAEATSEHPTCAGADSPHVAAPRGCDASGRRPEGQRRDWVVRLR